MTDSLGDRVLSEPCEGYRNRPVPLPATISLAPMLDVTHTEFRQFIRLLTHKCVNWTEMVVENTVIHCDDLDGFLGHDECEHPIVCQVGGSDPEGVGKAVKVISSWGYDEININCGCPSDRVASKGCFGAALLKEAKLVKELFTAMVANAGETPCNIKMRLGVDEFETYEFAYDFVKLLADAGCTHFIVHARKCWLRGLSPAKNRTVPPLWWDRIYRLALDFPNVRFTVNGGVPDLDVCEALLRGTWRPEGWEDAVAASANADLTSTHEVKAKISDTLQSTHVWEMNADELISKLRSLRHEQYRSLHGVPFPGEASEIHLLEGIMMGRAAMNTIWVFADIDRRFFNVPNPPTAYSRRTVMEAWRDIIRKKHPQPFKQHGPAYKWVQPLLGFFGGLPGNRLLRNMMERKLRQDVTTQPLADMLDELMEALETELPGLLDVPIFKEDGTSGAADVHALLKAKNDKIKAEQKAREAAEEVLALETAANIQESVSA